MSSRTELPDSATRRERPTSLELSAPATLGPRLSGSPAYAWGSQDSVFKLEEIPEGDEDLTATETSEESSSSPSPTGGEDGRDGGPDGGAEGGPDSGGGPGGGAGDDAGHGGGDGNGTGGSGAGGDSGGGGDGGESGGGERRRAAPAASHPAQDTDERAATGPGTNPVVPATNGSAVLFTAAAPAPTAEAPAPGANGSVARGSPRPADQPEGRSTPWHFPVPTITPKPPLNLQGVRFTEPGAEPPSPAPQPQTPAVTVSAASFCWRCGGAAALRDVSLTVPRAKLTMIVGPIGSGKSSLVTALLGELCRTSGSVTWAR